jgi:AcrR family transcriptional regulator
VPALDPRKTPRQRRSAATVDAILEAAAHILERQGLAALTTNGVAERAGASIGSLYQYFPNKEAVLAALIRRERVALAASVAAALNGPGGFAAQLDRLVAAAVAHQLARPALARALDYAERGLPLQAEDAALAAAMARDIAGFLAAHGVPEPALAARDCVALARGMIDAAGEAGETDAAALALRVRRAVRGYLGRDRAGAKPLSRPASLR